MLKQSIFFIFLQLLNLFVGLFTSLYIAVNVEPEIYSLLVIYIIVNGLYMTFTAVGYETILIRNALNWQKNKLTKLKSFITYAIVTRVFLSILLTMPVVVYLFYISENKLNSNRLEILLLFVISGSFSSLNNSIGLILKSFNRYISSFCVIVLGSLITKLIAFAAFSSMGFISFIMVMVLSPMVIFIFSYGLISKHIDYSMYRARYFWKFKRYMPFGLLGYAKYFVGQSDRFIVSLLLTTELLASYSLAKQVQEVGKAFIEGFFDPLCQKAIAYKTQRDKFFSHINKVKKINYVMILLGFVICSLIILYIENVVTAYGFDKYQYLDTFVIFAAFSSLFYLCYKVEGTLVSLFESPNQLLKIDMFTWALSMSTLYAVHILHADYWLFSSRVLVELILLNVFFIVWNKKKSQYIGQCSL